MAKYSHVVSTGEPVVCQLKIGLIPGWPQGPWGRHGSVALRAGFRQLAARFLSALGGDDTPRCDGAVWWLFVRCLVGWVEGPHKPLRNIAGIRLDTCWFGSCGGACQLDLYAHTDVLKRFRTRFKRCLYICPRYGSRVIREMCFH